MAVFASPLLTVAANPQSIVSSPAVDLIKSIPAVWDESRALKESEIGELAAFARRKGNTWFLAVMCGPEAKTIRVPLAFLGGGSYKTMLVGDDGSDGSTTKIENTTHRSNDSLDIKMRAGGGFIARFSRP